MTNIHPEAFVAEVARQGEPINQLVDLVANNIEAIAAGSVFFVMLGNDVVAIGTDIMADGKFDPKDVKDWTALGKGVVRVVGSGASSFFLYGAVSKNPFVTAGVAGVGVYAIAHAEKLAEVVNDVISERSWKEKVAKSIEATAGLAIGGLAIGAAEAALFSGDPTAWVLGNASLITYFSTHPKEAFALADLVRSYYQKSGKK